MSEFLDKIEAAIANRAANYWAKMRTNLALAAKSDFVDDITIDHIRAELEDILDSGILSYPPTLEQLDINDEMSLQERKDAFGIRPSVGARTYNEEKFLEDMQHKTDQVRKANWSWRIGQEAQEKQVQGWHPFFVTLTVDPKRADPEKIWREGKEFRKYIRKLADIVCKEVGDPPCRKKPYRPESNYVTYAGVIEHGRSREHHHGHFMIWMREIPSSWKVCPNTTISNPANRVKNECKPMETIWEHSSYDPLNGKSLSPCQYFRSIGDIWEQKYRFVLPLRNGRAMKVNTPRIAGSYITKYLTKEHKEWHHRMKATRNLGMKTLRKVLKSMSQVHVSCLAMRPEKSSLNLSLMKIHSVPLGLVRSEAKRRKFLLEFRQRQLDLTDLLRNNSLVFTRMLRSVKAGARPDRMSSAEFYDWVGKFLPDQKGYSERSITVSHLLLQEHFPVAPPPVQHTKIGANDIGHS